MAYSYQTADPMLYPLLRDLARKNRNNPTEAEILLWNYLKNNGLGVLFKRQHIIGDYITDFVCMDSKLIVELDGGYHQLPQQQTNDAERTKWLENKGYKIIRFTNEELFENIDGVLEKIKEKLYE
ncbi:MAG: endonuclease domain-containing protein [Prevotella sp.]|nr:endonuclease domain-containing protein [Prevotella sp.]